MLDRSIFSRRVHRLKNQKQSPFVLGIQHVLQFRRAIHSLLQLFGGIVLRIPAVSIAGIEIFQLEPLAVIDAIHVG